ncbi:MAG: PepSY domain-containing protein [Ardenticatenia bacterium]|nr:PepSY domain-containing protein [Ardenticatenia bacterium]
MLKEILGTIRALLLGVLVGVVFVVGLTTGTRLEGVSGIRADRTPTPDLVATISALEARIEELVQEAPGGAMRASTPTSPRPPTPTLRVVTRGTVVGTWGSVEKDRAVEIAREYVGGGEVIAVTQEKKYGTVVLEVEFRYGSEVYVDVQSGRVLYAEISPADRQAGTNTTSTPTPVPTSTPTLVPPTATPLPTATLAPTATPTPEPVPLATGDEDEQGEMRDEEAQQQPSAEEAEEDEQAVSPPAPQEHEEDDSPHQDESRSDNDDQDDRDDGTDDDDDKDDNNKDDDDDDEHEDDD